MYSHEHEVEEQGIVSLVLRSGGTKLLESNNISTHVSLLLLVASNSLSNDGSCPL